MGSSLVVAVVVVVVGVPVVVVVSEVVLVVDVVAHSTCLMYKSNHRFAV